MDHFQTSANPQVMFKLTGEIDEFYLLAMRLADQSAVSMAVQLR
jgi:hypothetical protein